MMKNKQCKDCSQEKPANRFHKNRNVCKDCWNARKRAWRAKNKEKLQAKRDANRESRRAYQKEYYWKNREAILKKCRRYRQENSNEIKAYRQQRVQELPDAYVAKILRKNTSLTKEDLLQYPELIAAYRQYLINKRKIAEHDQHDRIRQILDRPGADRLPNRSRPCPHPHVDSRAAGNEKVPKKMEARPAKGH